MGCGADGIRPAEFRGGSTDNAHEVPDGRAPPPARGKFLDDQRRVAGLDPAVHPLEGGLAIRNVRHHLLQGVPKLLKDMEQIQHECQPHAREHLPRRGLDPFLPVRQDHDLVAVERAAPPRARDGPRRPTFRRPGPPRC